MKEDESIQEKRSRNDIIVYLKEECTTNLKSSMNSNDLEKIENK